MASLIVYGSLMAKDEIASLGCDLSLAQPVWVQGYQRAFAQEPSWRKGVGDQRAVLTVVRSPLHSFNGILLRSISAEMFFQLDIRERGYHRQLVELQHISAFSPTETRSIAEDSVDLYVGKPEFYNDSLQPNPSYLAICFRAAQDWGQEFYHQFHQTTEGYQS